ncbi:carbohydrate ABC transporter permease [Caldanaerobacter subterraneus]|uniref:Carbohydrate ABC transporter permease n=1 Tax=Caldanaerobacter subterraneus TaxID=911092 RepID=A0A7Y2L715_9THEO|nr:carbohydrate ABC transporter permease [Caldanaerobacter subterraneus]NNG66857.1 carbohydrate ABC transporter permease [Caldanaerobacter subterraneus]
MKKTKFPWFSGLVVILGAITMVVPFLDMIFTSFKQPEELRSIYYVLLPKKFSFENYIEAFKNMEMSKLFLNSTIVSVSVTLSVLFTSTLAGYALAKLRFPGRDSIFKFILSTMMFPGFLFLIPNFYIITHFPMVGGNDIFGKGGYGFAGSYLALILPFAVSAFGIFLMRQFILQIPNELIEAARIDGASEFRIFWQIVVPSSLPAMATLAIFTFIGQWNEFIWPLLIYTVNSDLATLPVGIQMLQSSLDPLKTRALVSAAMTMSVIPVFILFMFLQKYYIQGFLVSGLKD